MDFANERYVRLYTRDTTGWKLLGFEGRTVFTLLYRKADRSGVIDLAGLEPWEAGAVHEDIPEEIARVGMARCLKRGWIVVDDDRLVFPEYIPANETPQSDAQRQRESRAKRAVTKRDASSQNVTDCHTESHGVTPRHSVPSLAVPSEKEEKEIQPAPAAAALSTNLGTPGGGGESSHVRSVDSLSAAGRMWLASVLDRDDFDHRGKWEHAFTQLAQKPETEKRAAAAAIRSQLGKSGIRQKLKPQHVLDYWADYVDGKPPGGFASAAAVQPGAAEVAAAKEEFAQAQERYRAAPAEHREAMRAKWAEADKKLKDTKARFAWTG
jgi:hypothetical protein